MKLEQYLEAIEKCPDEKVVLNKETGYSLWILTTDFGIYDNWPILLGTNYEDILTNLKKFNFILESQKENKYERNACANYNPGTVIALISDKVDSSVLGKAPVNSSLIPLEDYSTALTLHPTQYEKIKGVNEMRAIAMAIRDIGKSAIKRNISLCFPSSMGFYNNRNKSQIVFYP